MTKDSHKEKLIYLSGIFDGEGCVSIGRQKRTFGYVYQQQLSIGNTDIRLIEWLIENFGGSMPKTQKKEGNRKYNYLWSLHGSKSYKLLKKIHPYLIIKQEQADNAIELWEKVSKWHYGGGDISNKRFMPEHKRKLAEELYQRNKELNMKGKNKETKSKLVRRERIITLEEFE